MTLFQNLLYCHCHADFQVKLKCMSPPAKMPGRITVLLMCPCFILFLPRWPSPCRSEQGQGSLWILLQTLGEYTGPGWEPFMPLQWFMWTDEIKKLLSSLSFSTHSTNCGGAVVCATYYKCLLSTPWMRSSRHFYPPHNLQGNSIRQNLTNII